MLVASLHLHCVCTFFSMLVPPSEFTSAQQTGCYSCYWGSGRRNGHCHSALLTVSLELYEFFPARLTSQIFLVVRSALYLDHGDGAYHPLSLRDASLAGAAHLHCAFFPLAGLCYSPAVFLLSEEAVCVSWMDGPYPVSTCTAEYLVYKLWFDTDLGDAFYILTVRCQTIIQPLAIVRPLSRPPRIMWDRALCFVFCSALQDLIWKGMVGS